jgi:hypothetical protein
MSNEQAIRKLWSELDQKYIELDKTKEQLRASLSIQLLWPDAFKHGKCTSYLQGNLNRPKSMYFQIKNGNNETKDFQLMNIPSLLLKRAIEYQKKPNGHNQWQIRQLDKLYEYITKRKEQLNYAENQ